MLFIVEQWCNLTRFYLGCQELFTIIFIGKSLNPIKTILSYLLKVSNQSIQRQKIKREPAYLFSFLMDLRHNLRIKTILSSLLGFGIFGIFGMHSSIAPAYRFKISFVCYKCFCLHVTSSLFKKVFCR